MKFFLDLPIPNLSKKIVFNEPLFLIGSCFTEHIGSKLSSLHFPVMQNPHGILFDSLAIARAIDDYINKRIYSEADLFLLNDVWNSWNFHTSYSDPIKSNCLEKINHSIGLSHEFLKSSKWLVITLGSAFSYSLNENGNSVANCHKANQSIFTKNLKSVASLEILWTQLISKIKIFNPSINIVFTVSPVRHIRDGVIENNRSKARLIEIVHQFVNNRDIFYFPAYEYQIDILRDYRFYDIDFVHPNFAATEYIFNRFIDWFLHPSEKELFESMRSLRDAMNHRPRHPGTALHKQFLLQHLEKSKLLQKNYSFFDLKKEITYFSQ